MGKDLKGKELGTGLCQRKDGRYSARFTTQNGKRTEKYFFKLNEAKDWLYKQKYLDTLLITGDMTVNEWYEHWIKTFKEGVVADNTTKNYKQRYKYNIKRELGNMKLTDVKQIHCQMIINKMSNNGRYSCGTVELTKITMHAICKGAVESGYITRNPAEGLKFKKNEEDDERRVLTREEEQIFKEYAKDSLYYNAYCLVLETGLRAGEIGGLQWDDINLTKKTLDVRRTLLQEKSKGGFYFGVPKSKKSKRTIPLTKNAISLLSDQLTLQKKLKNRSKHWNDQWDGLVFTTTNGNPVGASTLRMMMVRVVNNINEDRKAECTKGTYQEFEHIYMHALRHTFATRCIERGMQPKSLQKILGHSSVTVTMDTYVHTTDEQMFLEMNKFENAI